MPRSPNVGIKYTFEQGADGTKRYQAIVSIEGRIGHVEWAHQAAASALLNVDNVLDAPITLLELPPKILRLLKANLDDHDFIGDLVQLTPYELYLACPGLGWKSMNKIWNALASHGLIMGMSYAWEKKE